MNINKINNNVLRIGLRTIEKDIYSIKEKDNIITIIFKENTLSFDFLSEYLSNYSYKWDIDCDIETQRVITKIYR